MHHNCFRAIRWSHQHSRIKSSTNPIVVNTMSVSKLLLLLTFPFTFLLFLSRPIIVISCYQHHLLQCGSASQSSLRVHSVHMCVHEQAMNWRYGINYSYCYVEHVSMATHVLIQVLVLLTCRFQSEFVVNSKILH